MDERCFFSLGAHMSRTTLQAARGGIHMHICIAPRLTALQTLWSKRSAELLLLATEKWKVLFAVVIACLRTQHGEIDGVMPSCVPHCDCPGCVQICQPTRSGSTLSGSSLAGKVVWLPRQATVRAV